MTTNGQRGTLFERECRVDLERQGFVVIRSAASKTGVDLVALGNPTTPVCGFPALESGRGEVWLVQCKTNGRFDHGEWNALYTLAFNCGAVPILACREKEGRRLVPAFYVLTGPRTPHSRTWPKRRIHMPEVTHAEQ